jgi:hypothetical protein
VDFFSFEADSDKTYLIDTTILTLTDILLTVYDTDGTTEIDHVSLGVDGTSDYLLTPFSLFETTDTYYFSVEGVGVETGTYTTVVVENGDGDSDCFIGTASYEGNTKKTTILDSILIKVKQFLD